MLMWFAGVSHAELKSVFVNVAKVLEKSTASSKGQDPVGIEFSPRDKALVSQKRNQISGG